MKKFLMIALMGMFLTTIFSSCHKDIPKDIPDWLREKIKEVKKETKAINKKYSGTVKYRSFEEFSNGNITLYYYNPDGGTSPQGHYIYDKEGNELCLHSPGVSSSPCGPYTFNEILTSFIKIRTIWKS